MKKKDIHRKRILVVDDADDVASYFANALAGYGEVEKSNNTLAALQKVSLHRYDLIIMDMCMPGMDGIEFYEVAVEADPTLKNRFLFLTNSYLRNYMKFLLDNDLPFLFRPVGIVEIREAVEEIMSKTAKFPREAPAS